jgi:hypothetical protein
MPPRLDWATIKLLDELNEGDPIIVEYCIGGDKAISKGRYGGQENNSIGTRCIAVSGIRESRIRIPLEHVNSVKRKMK